MQYVKMQDKIAGVNEYIVTKQVLVISFKVQNAFNTNIFEHIFILLVASLQPNMAISETSLALINNLVTEFIERWIGTYATCP